MNGEANELINKMVENLVSVSDERRYALTAAIGGYFSDRMLPIMEALYDSVGNSDFGWIHGQVFFFDGRTYIPVPSDDYIDRALELFLVKMRCPAFVVTRCRAQVIQKFHQSLRLNRELKPRYNVMAFRNGVVDMNDGILRPFDPKYHVIYLHDYEYDPNAECPVWKNFLRGGGKGNVGVLPDRNDRMILQMFMGLGLFDRGYMQDKVENCLILYGNGSNGKSVIMETIMGVFGHDNVSTMGLGDLVSGGDERLRSMAKVDGKVFNWGGELQMKSMMGCEDSVKSLFSGERQYGRLLGHDIYQITNVPWFVFNANKMPKWEDSTNGFHRRFIYLVFDRVIADKDQNKRLTFELQKEYPGILNWVRRGRKYLEQNKFHFPDSKGSLRKKLIEIGRNNIGRSWLLAYNITAYPSNVKMIDSGMEVSFKDMYDSAVSYAAANGFDMSSFTANTFASQLRTAGFGASSKRKTSSDIMYRIFGAEKGFLMEDPVIVADMDPDVEDPTALMDPED